MPERSSIHRLFPTSKHIEWLESESRVEEYLYMYEEHQLHLTEVRDYHGIVCSYCRILIRHGSSYACLVCNYGFHKACVEPPPASAEASASPTERTLIHCLKQGCIYSLQLIKRNEIDRFVLEPCDVCGKPCGGPVSYTCNTHDDRRVHEYCAHDGPLKVRHYFHPHELHIGPCCGPQVVSPVKHCTACESRFPEWKENLRVYRCPECPDIAIHVNCAREMPSFKHDGHEQHPLTLLGIEVEDVNYNRLQCAWCSDDWYDQEGGRNGLAAYRCVHCDFSLHKSCAKYPKYTTSEEHDEEHTLRYFSPSNPEQEYQWSSDHYCQSCGENIAEDRPVYKCLTCPDYLFHRHCIISNSQDLESRGVSSVEETFPLFREVCQALGQENCNFPAPSLLVTDELISASRGKIECLYRQLETQISDFLSDKSQKPVLDVMKEKVVQAKSVLAVRTTT